MNAGYRKISACRLCSGTDLAPYINFGAVPLGNNLQTTPEAARAAETYPLALMRCRTCGHFQLAHAVDPNLLYATNYTYLSGIGTSFIKHFDAYAGWIGEHCELPSDALVVDVGSNDGTCLKAFKARDYRVCGVDPAVLAAQLAIENGVETLNCFFDSAAVEEIERRHGRADLVTSHNVLAHVDDLAAVFRNVHSLLKDGGYFAFEVGYFGEVLRRGQFDTIYHEHLDYHHAAPLVRHLTALGFEVLDLSLNEVQGGSIRLLMRKTGRGAVGPAAQAFLAKEAKSVLSDEDFLSNWRRRIETEMATLSALLRARIEAGKVVAAYGAPTKATLLMKMAGIGPGDIAYAVEDNPHKTGRYLPGAAVPIRSQAELTAVPPDVIVLFAWNFAADIIGKLTGKFPRAIEIVIPLPELKTVIL
jgi:SAM-dependent methyltransferase